MQIDVVPCSELLNKYLHNNACIRNMMSFCLPIFTSQYFSLSSLTVSIMYVISHRFNETSINIPFWNFQIRHDQEVVKVRSMGKTTTLFLEPNSKNTCLAKDLSSMVNTTNNIMGRA